MKRIMRIIHTLILLACTSAGAADAIPPRATAQPVAAPPAKPAVQKGEMAGYLLVPHAKVPETFNAGFSLYAAAWPANCRCTGNRIYCCTRAASPDKRRAWVHGHVVKELLA